MPILVLSAIFLCSIGLYQIVKTFINLWKDVSKPYSSILCIIFGSMSTVLGVALWIVFIS